MKFTLFAPVILLVLAAPVFADDYLMEAGRLTDLLDAAPDLSSEGLKPVLQYPQYPPSQPVLPGPGGPPKRKLFPGPKFISIDFGVAWVPIVGGGAADDSTPHLASYRKYWDTGWSAQANLHIHVLSIADAYVGVGAVHHPTSGGRDWYTTQGANNIHIRYRFDPLYIFPIEFGGKGYLKLKAPPGLGIFSPGRAAPMLYLKIGAGPAFVNTVNLRYKRYVNGTLQSTLDNVWWPWQSVLNVHVAFGFEWGSFTTKKGRKLGLFAEVAYRYMAAPVVTDFGDTSDPMQTIMITVGMHIP